MQLLNKNTDYAVRALLYLGRREGEFVSSREIAEANGIPLRFMRRLLLALRRQKMIESKEGSGGGVKLAREPARVNLLDIITVFQGPTQLSQCMFRKKICPNRPTCVLRRQIKRVEGIIIKEFKGLTLKHLLRKR